VPSAPIARATAPVNGPAASVVRRRVVVGGRVQGVGFRASCAYRAELARLGGWVRNLADGRVEAVFEGDRTGVEAIVTWCRTGPAMARVADVEVADEHPLGQHGFEIR
jgi:acylphosphatase